MDNLSRQEIEERVAKGEELFKNGYNCSQAVFLAFSDLYGIDHELAAKLSAPFGGGIGKMRLTCGAACALFMLSGMETGSSDPKDKAARSENYAQVQEFAAEFARLNDKLECQLAPRKDLPAGEKPKIRPCPEIVKNACRIYADYLINKCNKQD